MRREVWPPLAALMDEVRMPLSVLLVRAEDGAALRRYLEEVALLTARALWANRRVGRWALERLAGDWGWSQEQMVMAAWVLALNDCWKGCSRW